MKKALILIIDQSRETRAMYGDCFRYHGYAVVEAADGQEALRLCASRQPDLIVTELAEEWADAIRALRTPGSGPEAATIVCSTRIDPVWLYLPSYIDAELVCAKPMSPGRLLGEAEDLLARRFDGRYAIAGGA